MGGPAGKSDLSGPSVVFGLRRINLIYPVEGRPLAVQHPLAPDGSQEIGRSCASPAHVAVHNDLLLGIQLGIAPRDFPERNQLGSRNPIDLNLIRLPDIDNARSFAPVEPLLELD